MNFFRTSCDNRPLWAIQPKEPKPEIMLPPPPPPVDHPVELVKKKLSRAERRQKRREQKELEKQKKIRKAISRFLEN